MTPTLEVQKRIRRYLLGQLSDGVRDELERDLLTNEDLFEELLVVEDEIIDEYLNGRLKPEERARFEKHFLATPERHEKLKFGRAFDRYLSPQAGPALVTELKPSRSPWAWTQTFYSSPVRIAVCAIVIVAIALGVWQIFFRQSEVDKGLLALNAAYREQRPIEARISKLDYAPYATTRGPGTEKVDQNELRRAELTLLDALNKNPTPAVHHALGKVYLAKKEFDKAIEQFDEAVKGDPKNAQLNGDLGAAWLEKGKIDRDGKEPGKGMEELGRSLENLNKALELNPNLLEALFNRALCHQYLMLPHQAQDDWREYVKKDSASQWGDEARRNLKLLEGQNAQSDSPGQILKSFRDAYQRRDDDFAWKIMSQTREMITGKMVAFQLTREFLAEVQGREKNSSEILTVFIYAGNLEQRHTGDSYVNDLARYYANSSVSEHDLLAEGQRNVDAGYDLCLASKYGDALTRFSEARGRFAKAGDTLEAKTADYWIAYCENQIDRLEESTSLLNALITYSRLWNYKWLESQALYLLANSYVLLGETSEAIADNQLALRLAQDLSDTYNQQKILTEIAAEYTYIARPQRGLAFLEQSLALSETSPTIPRQAWRNFTYAAESFYSLRLYYAAAAYEEEALRLVEEQRWSASLAHLSQINLGMIYAGMQRFGEATRHVEESLKLANSLSDDPSSRRMIGYSTLQLAHLKRQAGDCSTALQLYDSALGLYDQMQFDIDKYDAHKGRLLCYLASDNDSSIEVELTHVLQLFEKYRAEIREEQNRNSFFDAEQSVYDIAVDYFFRKGDYGRAFSFSEASRARSLLDSLRTRTTLSRASDETDVTFSYVTRPLALDKIRDRLPADLQVVQYNVLKDRLLIWVISKERVDVVEEPVAATEINRNVIGYIKSLTKSASQIDEIKRGARALYALLISPIESRLDVGREICFIPDKTLFYLPFASLVSTRTGEYLIARQPILYSPSASVLVLTTETARSRAGDEALLAVANPTFSAEDYPDLAALPESEREARKIAEDYKASVALLGREAVKESVLQQMRQKSIVHFACHYLTDESTPMNSKLLLASPARHPTEDSALSGSDVLKNGLPKARLIVLSACQTGGERYYNGEGIVGIARTFLVAGAPLVVASQWPVDSAATAELMIKFHRYRTLERSPTTAALRRAQLDLLNGPDARYQHPYYWAAFFPVGGYTSY